MRIASSPSEKPKTRKPWCALYSRNQPTKSTNQPNGQTDEPNCYIQQSHPFVFKLDMRMTQSKHKLKEFITTNSMLQSST